MSTLADEPLCPERGDLQILRRFMYRIRVSLEVTDDDGGDVLSISAESEDVFEGEIEGQAITDLLIEIHGQWKELHDSLRLRIFGHHFGHLEPKMVEQLDIMILTGERLLDQFKAAFKQKHDGVSDPIVDLAASLEALRIVEQSYQFNFSDKELDGICKEALAEG